MLPVRQEILACSTSAPPPSLFLHFSTAACLFMLVTFINRLAEKEKNAKGSRKAESEWKAQSAAKTWPQRCRGNVVQRTAWRMLVVLNWVIRQTRTHTHTATHTQRQTGSTCKFINQSTNHIEYRVLLLLLLLSACWWPYYAPHQEAQYPSPLSSLCYLPQPTHCAVSTCFKYLSGATAATVCQLCHWFSSDDLPLSHYSTPFLLPLPAEQIFMPTVQYFIQVAENS